MSITELWMPITELLSHPIYRGWVTLCFCTGSYAPLPPPPPPPTTDICSRDNFWITFRISFTLVWLMTLTCRLDYLTKYWSIFVVTLTLNWIFKVKYGICPKWSDWHETKSKHKPTGKSLHMCLYLWIIYVIVDVLLFFCLISCTCNRPVTMLNMCVSFVFVYFTPVRACGL